MTEASLLARIEQLEHSVAELQQQSAMDTKAIIALFVGFSAFLAAPIWGFDLMGSVELAGGMFFATYFLPNFIPTVWRTYQCRNKISVGKSEPAR